MAFAETQWPPPSLKFFYLQALSSKAPYNETHWKNGDLERSTFKAIGETDQANGAADMEPGAEDPVRPGWLHQLDERRLGATGSPTRSRASNRSPPACSATTVHERLAVRVATLRSTVAEPRAADREASPVLGFVGRRLLGAVGGRCCVASVVIFFGTAGAARRRRQRRPRPQRHPGGRADLQQADAPRTSRWRAVHHWLGGSCTATWATRRSACAQGRSTRHLGVDLGPGQELADAGAHHRSAHDPRSRWPWRVAAVSPGPLADHAISIMLARRRSRCPSS